MKVEVELEDLETIVFATAVIRAIESNLAQRKLDPFVQPHLEYSQAHEALTAVMNAAKRGAADTTVEWDGELTKKEIAFLERFSDDHPVVEVGAETRRKMKEIDDLMSKGCVIIGQQVVGAVWPGARQADIKPYGGYSVKITPRGIQKYQAFLK